ncbi:MAG: hypothetical protein ACYTEZ_08600 [Planctomycetota bacterium]
MRTRTSLAIALGLAAGLVGGGEGRVTRDVRTKRFATSIVCYFCHSNAKDAGALRDGQGRGIAPHDLWRSSMMANASRDPFFLAALAAEVAGRPAERAAIEARCLHCHAPMASVEERLAGRPGLDREDLDRDDEESDDDRAALARDGVSCTVCHQILPDNLGTEESFTGGFDIGEDRLIFGPHGDQWGMPMKRITQYWPEQGQHVVRSAMCATCHTSFLETPDGRTLPESAAYLEWRNSAFNDEGDTPGPLAASCRDCHVPVTSVGGAEIRTRIARSSHGGDLPHLQPLQPVGRHIFVGGNTLIPAILRDHGEELRVKAPIDAFDATIARAREQLRERTASIEIEDTIAGAESLSVTVRVRNLTGHKFPTGHASRRAWLRLRLRDAEGRVIFASGESDGQGRIVGRDGEPLAFESAGGPIAPHRKSVSSETELQIYEAVLAGQDGAPEFLTLRAARYAKDNRLLPRGWSPEHRHAAETAPAGTDGDPDFAAGGDLVHYEIALAAEPKGFSVEVALLYQPLSARFAAELFRIDAPDIRRFRQLFEAAERAPELVARAQMTLPAE